MGKMIRPALLALAALCCAQVAEASDCIMGRGNQCFPSVVIVDPTTGAANAPVTDNAVVNALSGPTPAGTNHLGDVSQSPNDAKIIAPTSCSASCNGTDLLPSFDTSGYAGIHLQMTAIGSGGNLQLQGSDDADCTAATHWTALPMWLENSNQGQVSSTNFNFVGAIGSIKRMHCERLTFIAYTSGTYTAQGLMTAYPAVEGTSGTQAFAPTPSAGTQTINSASGTGAQTAALGTQSGRTTYICGISVDVIGATAGGTVTITGLLFNMSIAYDPTKGPLVRNWSPCLSSSAQNTAITLSAPALTGETAKTLNVNGYFAQ